MYTCTAIGRDCGLKVKVEGKGRWLSDHVPVSITAIPRFETWTALPTSSSSTKPRVTVWSAECNRLSYIYIWLGGPYGQAKGATRAEARQRGVRSFVGAVTVGLC
jgi:hypothetical protein